MTDTELTKELAETKTKLAAADLAIEETLALADRLNSYAMQGAGAGEHWGERVLQAVQALRNVKIMPNQTLAHNELLLKANSENIRKIEQLEKELAKFKKDKP
jgi:hypothetical protein